MQKNKINIEVVYASTTKQEIIALEVEEGETIEMAIMASGILKKFPEIDLNQQKVGVFSQLKKLTDRVSQGDRVEIYRSLLIDPKEARRRRKSSI